MSESLINSSPRRIAMWSGPRNISTAMMRSFENRSDTCVIDEPFYAFYLQQTGLNHPMREDIIASGTTNADNVINEICGPIGREVSVFYQKHMTHHILPEIERSWMYRDDFVHIFLIRRPENVLTSYAAKRADVTLRDIGFVEQRQLFDEITEKTGRLPCVIEASRMLQAPEECLPKLCEACAIPYDKAMLQWAPGPRASDGIWAKHWYNAVETTTQFARQRPDVKIETLSSEHQSIAYEARAHYEALLQHAL